MAFTVVNATDLSAIAQFNQIMTAWEGNAGAGNPMLLTKHEGSDYSVDVLQNDTIFCKMLRAQTWSGSAGTVRLEISGPAAGGNPIYIGHNVTLLKSLRVDGVDVSAHVHTGGTLGVAVKHSSLAGRNADDHTDYYNAARHTKALHDGLGIDAGTLGTKPAASFPPWADFKLSKSVQSATGWNMPNAANTWGDVGAMTLTIAPTAISDFNIFFNANIEAKAGDYNGDWHFRVACTPTGGTTVYSEEFVGRTTETANGAMFTMAFQGLEPGTYTVKAQFKRTVYAAGRQILSRRMSAIVLPSTPIAVTDDLSITLPSQSYKMGDTINVTVQYQPNTPVWLTCNCELTGVIRGTTSASGVATLSMPVAAPLFVEGSGSSDGMSNIGMIAVLSVWAGDSPTRVAHAYAVVAGGNKCEIVNPVVGASTVTGTLRQVATGGGVVGVKVYAWGDEGEAQALTTTGGAFSISVTNCKYIIFKGAVLSTVSYAGCAYNADAAFNVAYTRLTAKPMGMWHRPAAGNTFCGGRYWFFPWRDLHPNASGANEFNLSTIDAKIAEAVAGGYKLGIGISIYGVQFDNTPYHIERGPNWMPAADRYYLMQSGDVTAYLPCYNKTVYKAALKRLIVKLAAEYDGNPNIAFVNIGLGIDDEHVITKDGGGVKWRTDAKIHDPYCTDNEYETFKQEMYDEHVARWTTTPLVWRGFRPKSRLAYRLAKDGVTYQTNAFSEKGYGMGYGASGTRGCVDMLEGLLESGCEPRGGPGFNGSEFIGTYPNYTYVTRDLSGHLYTIASHLQWGNRNITMYPEYMESILLGIPAYGDWFVRALAKNNHWWLLIRELPQVVTQDGAGKTLALDSNGEAPQRGSFGYKMTITGGSLVTRAEWLATNVPRTTMNNLTYIRTTLYDCQPIEATYGLEEAPDAWNNIFSVCGRKGTPTLHFLGAPTGTYSGYFGFYGPGGFSVGGVAVPTATTGEQVVKVSNFTMKGGQLPIALGDTNFLCFVSVWRET
jgi:hypothetical protein